MLNPFQKTKTSLSKPSWNKPITNFSKPDIIRTYEKIVIDQGRLRQSGRATITKCPFHNDHKPSFSMYSDNNTYHCFSCGVDGDSFKMIMEILKMTFQEAKQFAINSGLIK